MARIYHNISILFKKGHGQARVLARKVSEWLQERHARVKVAEAPSEHVPQLDNIDLTVVLGGDGTILGVARKLAGKGIPILGINFGKVGFLTAATPDNWKDVLASALSGKIPVRHCLILKWQIIKADNKEGAAGCAINDIVIRAGRLARLIGIDIHANMENLGLLRSDGLIVSSPLGSSGYSVSAGGPLLAPEIQAVSLTPICPFITNIAPLVLPANTELSLDVCASDCYLTIDGQEGFQLKEHDRIKIACQPDGASFVGNARIYYEHLRVRGFKLEDRLQ